MRRRFWRLIATVEASAQVGVSWPVGAQWFRRAGGMTPLSVDEPTGRCLSFAEREEVALLDARDEGVREIARTIGRDPATASGELRRNAATRGGKPVYRARAWSPEQITRGPNLDFPDVESMRISHEAICQSLFIEGRGALERELAACLRTGRALREPRARSRNKPRGHVSGDVVLSERPAEAEDRAVPGHWEGDLIIGTGRSAIGTIFERSSRSTLLVHLPRLEGRGAKPQVKNEPSPGGYGPSRCTPRSRRR